MGLGGSDYFSQLIDLTVIAGLVKNLGVAVPCCWGEISSLVNLEPSSSELVLVLFETLLDLRVKHQVWLLLHELHQKWIVVLCFGTNFRKTLCFSNNAIELIIILRIHNLKNIISTKCSLNASY